MVSLVVTLYSTNMVHQIFKSENLTRTKVKNNILKIWGLTGETERYNWYGEALKYAESLAVDIEILEESTDRTININKAVGVLAALSPIKTWEQNKKCAFQMILTGKCGHTQLFVKKAQDILNSDGSDEAILSILNGRKISAFYLNIRYPEKANYITIDRHALSIGLGRWTTDEDYQGMTAKQYEFFVQCYTLAAMQVGVTPLLMQSATWVKWREIKTDY